VPDPVATPRRSRRQRPEESRAQILAAADRFLRKRPYRELTVDELMATTGFTRTVFYRHFDGLPGLVLEVMRAAGAELEGVSDTMARAEGDPERVRAGLASWVGFFDRHGSLVRAVADAASSDREIERVYEALLARFVDLTRVGLERALAAGAIRPLDPAAMAAALTALNERYLLRTLGREPRGDPAVALDAIWTIWRRTLYGGDAG